MLNESLMAMENQNEKPTRVYNFNQPVGQFIEHVDTVNFSMDKDGNFHFENVGEVKGNSSHTKHVQEERREELFHYIHPEIDDEEALRIHKSIKRLVMTQKVPEICAYLKELKQKGKAMLPPNPSIVYEEMVRMGMPTGDGYSDKYFAGCYKK